MTAVNLSNVPRCYYQAVKLLLLFAELAASEKFQGWGGLMVCKRSGVMPSDEVGLNSQGISDGFSHIDGASH